MAFWDLEDTWYFSFISQIERLKQREMKWLVQALETSSKYFYYWAEWNMDWTKSGNFDAAKELQVIFNKSVFLFLFWIKPNLV